MIKSVQDAGAWLSEDEKKGEQILVLVKIPRAIEKLLEQNIPIEKVILGGMGAGKGRKTFIKNVSASEDEIESFRNMNAKGIEIVYQLVPDEKETPIKKLL